MGLFTCTCRDPPVSTRLSNENVDLCVVRFAVEVGQRANSLRASRTGTASVKHSLVSHVKYSDFGPIAQNQYLLVERFRLRHGLWLCLTFQEV
jgi:hypothetical protein